MIGGLLTVLTDSLRLTCISFVRPWCQDLGVQNMCLPARKKGTGSLRCMRCMRCMVQFIVSLVSCINCTYDMRSKTYALRDTPCGRWHAIRLACMRQEVGRPGHRPWHDDLRATMQDRLGA